MAYFITSELFERVNYGIDRLETVIIEALSLISQSKVYEDVAMGRKVILSSVSLFTEVCEMKNCCRNTLETRSGTSNIAFKVTILFGSLYSIFVSRIIKKNRESTQH
jgi:hypothetical protein